MKEVDVALKAYTKDDYHRILNVHYPADSNFGKANNAALEEIFKYASWSVRFHKRSKWADNNYILIGRVRHYQANYKDGLETFKFVNSTSKSTKDKHEALICLMKFFTDFNEYDNVGYVIEYLDKEPEMTRKNKRNYLVAKASYYQHFEDYKKVYPLLDTAISLSRRRHDKAKLSFINGQISEYLKSESGETKVVLDFDADKEAYDNYTRTIKANPKYELWFNARLNRMRVSPASDLKDVDKARRYYKKMLADQKNIDYKDRIYYEFASFERKQKKYPDAEENYKKSVKNATFNQRQKAYSYLSLGEMYYDDQQRFEDAKLYYDSAIAILPTDHKGYGKIYRRQRILKEFVEHLNIVKREDSLQKLARMDTATLNRFLDDYISKEEKRLNDEAKQIAKEVRRNAKGNDQGPFNSTFTPTGDPTQAAGSPASPAGFNTGQQQTPVFYFYNQPIVARGKIEFQQKWGRRKLEDNWRISSKESDPDAIDQQKANPGDTSRISKKDTINGRIVDAKTDKKEDEEIEIKINKADLLATVPLTDEKLKASHEKIQPSIFRLGKIYSQNLNEPGNAVKSLQRLIDEYPDNEKVPEAHYMIYLISKGKDSLRMETNKNILLTKYPHTIYAKMIANPNYLAESKLLNKQIMARYKIAYQAYALKNYHEADSLFSLIQSDYPDSEYEPKIELVKTIMKARVGEKEQYRSGLQSYVDEYKSGSYHDYAQALIDKYDGKKPMEKEVPKDSTTPPVPVNPQMPDKFAPQTPANDFSNEMPEEVRKMYEQQMQNRNKGMNEQSQPNAPPENPAIPPAPVPATPAQVPPVGQNGIVPQGNQPQGGASLTPQPNSAVPSVQPVPSPNTTPEIAPGSQSIPPEPVPSSGQQTLPQKNSTPVLPAPSSQPVEQSVPPSNPAPINPTPAPQTVPSGTTPVPLQEDNRKGF